MSTPAISEQVAKTLPKIWYTRIFSDIAARGDVDCVFEQPDLQSIIRFKNNYQAWRPDSGGNQPVALRLRPRKPKIKDAFTSEGFLLVSRALREVLEQFELGSTRLIELPIYEEDGETPSTYPPHYFVHVTETKPTLIPEQSKNIDRAIPPGASEPRPGARWRETYDPDELSVRPTASSGVGIWADARLRRRLFVSDRLKIAIEAAPICSKSLKFIPATVLP